MQNDLPESVRYVKNGTGGCWWNSARSRSQIHFGWKDTPKDLLLKPDFVALEKIARANPSRTRGKATQDINDLISILRTPSQHLWVTIEDGFMWWCTVLDEVSINPLG